MLPRELVERHINWIIADFIPFTSNGINYSIQSPSNQAKVIADQFFFEYYYKAIDNGILDSDGVYKLLVRYGIWNKDKEEILQKLIKDVEEIKVQIFNSYLDSGRIAKIRQSLVDTNSAINSLQAEKQTLDYLGADFIANYAKYQVLLGFSVYKNNKPLWKSMKRWELPDEMVKDVNSAMIKYRLDSQDYREIATSDSWRSIYNLKRGNLFGRPIVNYSEHQKYLITWSQTYDNVYKSPDCPPDEIINDFDALDGWFIVQRRKRESELNKSNIEAGMSDKIKNSEHIFVLSGDKDIDKVYSLNDVGGKVALHKRLNQINRAGIVSEANMIDTREFIRTKASEMKTGV